jgi:SAM-dependent methyltransferase
VVGVNADEWARRGSSFGTAAAEYAEYRPEYPADAVRWCAAPLRRGQPAGEQAGQDLAGLRVLDLGAGTGKLTRLLATLGGEVTAVEPDAAMLGQLRQWLPGVRALSGAAEAIPLPDGSVDLVLCGQAMHWFDMSRAIPEIARVLVPGGVLGAMWNSDDDRVEWVAGLQEAAEGAASPSLSHRRSEAAHFAAEQFGADLFTSVERAEFANSQAYTAGTLVAMLGTHSQVLIMEPAERERVLTRARDYLASRPETADGEFELPMVTSVVRTVRR